MAEIRLTKPSKHFTIFLTNSSLTAPGAHSVNAHGLCVVLCVRAAAYNSTRIKPNLETFEQRFFFITCYLFLLLLLPLLLLFPPLHHFHPRSAFVDSCPERACAVCTRFCVVLLHFHTFLTGFFVFVLFLFACSARSMVRWPGRCHGQKSCRCFRVLWQKWMK